MESGLRETEATCGGTIAPRPSPSWLKYELICRPRLADRLTSVNFESTFSRSSSIGGDIILTRCGGGGGIKSPWEGGDLPYQRGPPPPPPNPPLRLRGQRLLS